MYKCPNWSCSLVWKCLHKNKKVKPHNNQYRKSSIDLVFTSQEDDIQLRGFYPWAICVILVVFVGPKNTHFVEKYPATYLESFDIDYDMTR